MLETMVVKRLEECAVDVQKRLEEARPFLCQVRLVIGLAEGEICLSVPGPGGPCWIALHADDTIEIVLHTLALTQAANNNALHNALDKAVRRNQKK